MAYDSDWNWVDTTDNWSWDTMDQDLGLSSSSYDAGSTDWSWLKDFGGAALNFLGSPGGGAALGGLLGYLGQRDAPNTETQTQEPWLAQQPFLLDAFQMAANAAKGNDQVEKANQNYSAVLSGPTVNPMLGMNNPYLTTAIDQANADVTRAMNPALIAANRASGSYGNSGVAETYGRALTDAYSQNANNMRMADYTNQQNLQQQNVNNTLGFTTNAQNWAAQPASNYASTIGQQYGGVKSTPLYNNPTAGLLGGAVTGYKMFGG